LVVSHLAFPGSLAETDRLDPIHRTKSVTQNLALVSTLVLESCQRKIHARHKNIVKMVVKFIRKGI
jgi:hypothetical protein